MKQRFLVVYEHGKRNYGGFAPDIPGCGSLAKTLGVMRRRMKEVLEAQLASMAEDGEELPEPVTTSFDFGEIADESVDHYVVERLEIEVPEVHPATA
jgi:predicted RNase H-like HicB family nuclease